MKRHIIGTFLLSLLFIFNIYSGNNDLNVVNGKQPKKKKQIPEHDISREDNSTKIIKVLERLISYSPERPGLGNSLVKSMNHRNVENIIIILEDKYPFINAKIPLGKALLYWAVTNDYDDIVRILVNRGIDLNLTGLINSILHKACIKGDKDMVQKLLKHDIRIDIKDPQGHYALTKAMAYGHNEIVKLLVCYPINDNTVKRDMLRAALIWRMERSF